MVNHIPFNLASSINFLKGDIKKAFAKVIKVNKRAGYRLDISCALSLWKPYVKKNEGAGEVVGSKITGLIARFKWSQP